MKKHRKLFTLLIFALFFLADVGGIVKTLRAQTPPPTPQPQAGQQQGSEPPAFDPANPPWNQTRERVPKEVRDKEKETPSTACPPTVEYVSGGHKQITYKVTYEDPQTKVRTTITHETETETIGPPGGPERTFTTWKIVIEDPNDKKNKTRIEYKLGGSEETRSVRRGKDAWTGRPVQASDFPEPTTPSTPSQPSTTPPTPRQGSQLAPFSTVQLASVTRRPSFQELAPLLENRPRQFPFFLAAATTQERQAVASTEKESQHNMKIVTIGGPPSDPFVVVFEQPPQTTPEQFVQNPPGSTWDPSEDPKGPNTTTGGPGGSIPMTYIPGGFINIGSGWSSTRIQSSFACVAGDQDDDDDQTL